MQNDSRYRWKCGRRYGHWQSTPDDAQDAAVRAGLACWDDYPAHDGKRRWFAGPLVSIEAQRA